MAQEEDMAVNVLFTNATFIFSCPRSFLFWTRCTEVQSFPHWGFWSYCPWNSWNSEITVPETQRACRYPFCHGFPFFLPQHKLKEFMGKEKGKQKQRHWRVRVNSTPLGRVKYNPILSLNSQAEL